MIFILCILSLLLLYMVQTAFVFFFYQLKEFFELILKCKKKQKFYTDITSSIACSNLNLPVYIWNHMNYLW